MAEEAGEVSNREMTAEEKAIEEEYKIWKKNTPFLYDLVMTQSQDWASLTADWLPFSRVPRDACYSEHRLLLGTQTEGRDPNLLKVVTVKLPVDSAADEAQNAAGGGYGAITERISVSQRILHEGDVNRARHMPQNPDIVATKSTSTAVFVFDLTKHPSNELIAAKGSSTLEPARPRPQLSLAGHTGQGDALAWSPRNQGHCLSGSDDQIVCLWDVSATPAAQTTVEPLRVFRGHSANICDVSWHHTDASRFATASDDMSFAIWDARDESGKAAAVVAKAHEAEVNSVAFNPFCEFVLATAGNDKSAKLWDTRNTRAPLHVLMGGHKEPSVFGLQWSRKHETILATAGADRRVIVWDIGRIGDEQTADEAEDGPAELLFIHGGHTAQVYELSWNANDPWVVASVGSDNSVQVWQMAESIFADDPLAPRTQPPASELE